MGHPPPPVARHTLTPTDHLGAEHGHRRSAAAKWLVPVNPGPPESAKPDKLVATRRPVDEPPARSPAAVDLSQEAAGAVDDVELAQIPQARLDVAFESRVHDDHDAGLGAQA